MKRRVFLFCWVMVLVLQSGRAQQSIPINVPYFGFRAGYNYSNVYDKQLETLHADSKLGITTGFYLSIPIGRVTSFQPEILIAQRGFKGTGTTMGSAYEFSRTTTLLDIPLLLALRPIKQITILGGPQYSYTLKQKDKFSSASSQHEEEFKGNIRKGTLSFLSGFDFNLLPVVLGIRVGWDVQKNVTDNTTPLQYKNVWVQGTMGLKLPI